MLSPLGSVQIPLCSHSLLLRSWSSLSPYCTPHPSPGEGLPQHWSRACARMDTHTYIRHTHILTHTHTHTHSHTREEDSHTDQTHTHTHTPTQRKSYTLV